MKYRHIKNDILIAFFFIIPLFFTAKNEKVKIHTEALNALFQNVKVAQNRLPENVVETINFSDTSKLPDSGTLEFVGPHLSDFKFHQLYFKQKEIQEKVQVVHMKDVYVGRQCIFYYNNSFFYVRPTCQFNQERRYNYSKSVVANYHSLIAICHIWSHNYAHMLFDVLVPASLIPQNILDESYFVVQERFGYVSQILRVLGFESKRVLLLRGQDLIFAENVYTINPHSFYNLQRLTLKHLRDYCVRKFSLNQIPPFRFVLFNRETKRSLSNYLEVFDHLNKTFPQFVWEEKAQFINFVDSVQYFNQILLFFGPHGADFASMIFFQESAIVCEIQANTFVSCYLIFSNLIGFHHIISRIPTMEFDGYKTSTMPLSTATQMILQALHYIEK